MLRYNTVLFDLDGTLIDTNDLILTSFLYTLDRHFPGKYQREHIIPYMGEPLTTQMERFGGIEKRDLLVEDYREHNERVHDELVREFPHIVEALRELKSLGVKMGIVTTKMRKTAVMGASLFGIDKFMDTFVVFEDTENHKPHPDPLLKAMTALKGDPRTTIMVGDSQYDIQGAHNADVHAAGVAWSLKGPELLKTYHPEYMLYDMRELIAIVKGDPRESHAKD